MLSRASLTFGVLKMVDREASLHRHHVQESWRNPLFFNCRMCQDQGIPRGLRDRAGRLCRLPIASTYFPKAAFPVVRTAA